MELATRKHKLQRKRITLTPGALATGIFILLAIAAPLAFGAVDRIVQISLLVLFAIGVWAQPPSVVRPGRVGNALLVAAVAILLLKEFGPAAIFGKTYWRETLAQSFGVIFPWTHNPEPSRALDGLLTGIIAIVWFLWARTLAVERSQRVVMIWGMAASAAIVAVVSFLTRGMDPDAIYGLRYTPGWKGFGPFPNRNHTASFLAMGVLLGASCIGWAGSRRYFRLLGTAVVLSSISFAGLLATESRGGVVCLVLGLGVFLALVVVRFPSVRTLSAAAGGLLVMLAISFAFGSQVIARFTSKGSGAVSGDMRVPIWQDTLRVWKDAPIFGHGMGSFTQIFPMYQEVATGEAIVLHPESSWLQWLVELGALPVLFGAIALAIYVAPRVRTAVSANRSVFVRAGPFAAAAALLLHSLIDVPAHRWATAGFGLAALAIACSPGTLAGILPATRKAALVPAAIACFWTLPFLSDAPAWSPISLARLLAREQTTPFVSVRELERSLHYFPLNPTLRYSIALHQIDDPLGRRAAEWQQHFRIAARLMPGSWELAALQARASKSVAPGISLHYWQIAIERAGHRAEEVFGIAMDETRGLRGATPTWEQYARLHPEFLLTYARNVPEAASREALALWWNERASQSVDLADAEVGAYYSLVEQRGSHEQFQQFIRNHPERRARDFKTWVEFLHKWTEDDAAWDILEKEWPEPADRAATTSENAGLLASRWDSDPSDVVNARDFARHLLQAGDIERANEIILKVAARPTPPDWFVRKAARIHVINRDPRAAVALFLREPQVAK